MRPNDFSLMDFYFFCQSNWRTLSLNFINKILPLVYLGMVYYIPLDFELKTLCTKPLFLIRHSVTRGCVKRKLEKLVAKVQVSCTFMLLWKFEYCALVFFIISKERKKCLVLRCSPTSASLIGLSQTLVSNCRSPMIDTSTTTTTKY